MGRKAQRKRVEDYLVLRSKTFRDEQLYKQSFVSGRLRWLSGCSIGFRIDIEGSDGIMEVNYSITDEWRGEKKLYKYRICLESTPCYFGGLRWWFQCPLAKEGVVCGRRVGVLHLLGGYFGCRKCLNLVYQSSRDSHKFDCRFRKFNIDPKTAMALLKEGIPVI